MKQKCFNSYQNIPMSRATQYINLMNMVHSNAMIDTNPWLKDYMELYKEPIQIGTRLCELVRSWYLESTILENGRAIYTLTQRGIDWKGEQLVMYYKKVSPDKKPRKNKEESIVKKECKDINAELINTNKGTPKHSLREHIKSLLF